MKRTKEKERKVIEEAAHEQLKLIFEDLKHLEPETREIINISKDGEAVTTYVRETDQEFIKRRQETVKEAYELWKKLKDTKKLSVDWNTIIVGGVGLVQVFGIIFAESLGRVITTKAIPFVLKGRV